MRKSTCSEAQIVAILREGEAGVPVAYVLRKYGISRPTFTCGRRSTGAPVYRSCSDSRRWSRNTRS